jgi:hypothetical protein
MATIQLSRTHAQGDAASRWEPFKVLFEAQYLPLLLLALPQSFNVYKWLMDDTAWSTWIFAVIGGMAFEAAYVGVIAWADRNTQGKWFWITAFMALGFSIAVAVHVHYAKAGAWSVLHAGFPAVAFAYTMIMHNASPVVDVQALSSQRDEALQRVAELERVLTSHEAALLAAQSSLSTAVKDRDDARTLATNQQKQLEKAQQPAPISLDAVAVAVASQRLSLAAIVKEAAGRFPAKEQAAAALGMSRQTLSAWLDKAEVV